MNLKQDALAAELGFTQQKMSDLENKKMFKDEEIEAIAKAIQLPAQAIKYCDDQTLRDILVGSFGEINAWQPKSNCTIQPLLPLLDKYLAALEENKKLYERLLSSEQEKVAIMKKV